MNNSYKLLESDSYGDSYSTEVDFSSTQCNQASSDNDKEDAVTTPMSSISKKFVKKSSKKKSSKNTKHPRVFPRNRRNLWQPYEDAKLLELVAKYGTAWTVVASFIEGRTGK